MMFQLKVKDPKGKDNIIDICDDVEEMEKITVKQLGSKVKEELRMSDEFRMVYGAETLEESTCLMSYGVKHLSIIHCLLILPGGL